MQQKTLLMFFSAILAFLISGEVTVLLAKGSKSVQVAGRENNSYAAAYESGRAKGYSDITPDDHEEYNSAGSVSNDSIKIRSFDDDNPGETCRSSIYIVKKGDTLYSISRKTKVGIDTISDLNRLVRNRINPGMKLKIQSCDDSGKIKIQTEKKAFQKKEDITAKKFLWPLKKVNNFRRDGTEEVKSIGIFITGNANSDVIASCDGKIEKIGYMRGYGRYIAVRHEDRYVTVYSNLLKIYVKEGEKVKKGGIIGSLSEDKTLHFQIGHAGKPENPLKHLPGRS